MFSFRVAISTDEHLIIILWMFVLDVFGQIIVIIEDRAIFAEATSEQFFIVFMLEHDDSNGLSIRTQARDGQA